MAYVEDHRDVAGPEDDRTLWLGAEWQFNTAKKIIASTDIRIGLIHHPVDWLNTAERDIATRRITSQFHFWLHGHEHNAWVVPTQENVSIAAGAVGAKTPEEFGVNIVNRILFYCDYSLIKYSTTKKRDNEYC